VGLLLGQLGLFYMTETSGHQVCDGRMGRSEVEAENVRHISYFAIYYRSTLLCLPNLDAAYLLEKSKRQIN
jgi:hypothetical protein